MSTEAWALLALVGAAPLGAVAWLRWRLRPAKMNARADRHLADARARMRKRDDAALTALVRAAPLGHSPLAKRVRGLLDEGRYDELGRAWGDLWPELLHAPEPLSLDVAIDVGAAINVLAERHPPSPAKPARG
jgi:hypothetical protein